MSERAITWAQDQRCATATAKFCLMRLAAYADVAGVVWAYVERLAAEMQATDRTVQRAMRALERDGLIRRTGKFHHRNVPFYALDLERTVTLASPLNGDTGVTVGDANGDTGVTLNGDTGVTLKQGKPSLVEERSSPSERARAGEVDLFLVAFEAYPAMGRRGVSGERQAARAWDAELAAGAEVAQLVAACAAYAASPGDWGASKKPKAFHNFLETGAWKAFRGGVGEGSGEANGVRPDAWAGCEALADKPPREVFDALLKQRGMSAIGPIWPHVRWDAAGQRLVVYSATLAARLREARLPEGGGVAAVISRADWLAEQ